MRLALLGPPAKPDDIESLRKAAELVLSTLGVERVVYLGDDEKFDKVVAAWSLELAPKGEAGNWDEVRALSKAGGTKEGAEAWIRREEARIRLRKLEVLPRTTRLSLEMLAMRVAILTYDRDKLTSEDLAEASIVLYGKAASPRARAVGDQWYVSPGPTHSEGGIAVVEELGEGLRVTFYEPSGKIIGTESLKAAKKTKFAVQGAQ
jgi:hypothetical protein